MTASFEDGSWPRASEWLGWGGRASHAAQLVVVGAPMARQAITPGSYNLAPDAIRSALSRFTTFDLVHQHDLKHLTVHDAGNLPIENATPEDGFRLIQKKVSEALAHSVAIVLLGGNNSITYPACCGMGLPLERCGLITFDAHLDMRHLKFGLLNGNPVRALLEQGLPGNNIFQIGIQSFSNSAEYVADAIKAGIHIVPIDSILEHGLVPIVRDCLDQLSTRATGIYVDLDVDVLDRAYAPAAAGSRPGGLTPRELHQAIYECATRPNVRAMDIVEIDPTRDLNDATVLTAGACLLAFASGLVERVGKRN